MGSEHGSEHAAESFLEPQFTPPSPSFSPTDFVLSLDQRVLQSGSGMQRLVPELRPGSLVDGTLKVRGEGGALGGGDQQGHPFVLPLVRRYEAIASPYSFYRV